MPLDLPAEYLEVDGHPLVWWMELDCTPLLDGADLKGADTNVPHAHGSRVNKRRRAATTYKLTGFLMADRDRSGNEGAAAGIVTNNDGRIMLDSHLAFWRDSIAARLAPNPPSRPAILHKADGTIRTANVVIGRKLGLAGDGLYFACAVDLEIPKGGEFA